MKIAVCRKSHFNAAHRLHNPDWDDQKNEVVFGKCNNPNYHGHNYQLEVWVKGEIDPETGMVIDLKVLKDLIRREVEDRFDHKNLNLDTAEFKTLIPTAENICLTIWKILRDRVEPHLELKVRLFETDRNVVECGGTF